MAGGTFLGGAAVATLFIRTVMASPQQVSAAGASLAGAYNKVRRNISAQQEAEIRANAARANKAYKSAKARHQQAQRDLQNESRHSWKTIQSSASQYQRLGLASQSVGKKAAGRMTNAMQLDVAEAKAALKKYADYVKQVDSQLHAQMFKSSQKFAWGKGKGFVQYFGTADARQRKMMLQHHKEHVQKMVAQAHYLKKEVLAAEAAKNNKLKQHWMERLNMKRIEIKEASMQGRELRLLNQKRIMLERNALELEKATGRERKRLKKERVMLEKKLQKHLKETRAEEKRTHQMTQQLAQEMSMNFVSAIRDSAFALLGLYYKLNQVVTSFIEFEKQLYNAQSIFQTSNEVLFDLSDKIVQFGQQFGVQMSETSAGLYQIASAGMSAAQALDILTPSLTLAMATQGDANTLTKLTIQMLQGFGYESSYASVIVDKMAHSINKSLIEWNNLAAGIKFAMPWFTAANLSMDEMLGGLQILADRALEAGIAGRGLRQSLAQLIKYAKDNASAFRKMGIEIMDESGNMRSLVKISKEFSNIMGDQASDMEVMTTLMEDLGIRGATAFIHLVQNADEYEMRVNDLANSTGSAVKMAEIQQKSLTNQIQLVKNALEAPFLLSDEVYVQKGYLNAFAYELHNIVGEFENLIITGEDGNKQLTDFGKWIQEAGIALVKEMKDLIVDFIEILQDWQGQGLSVEKMLKALTIPLRILLKVLQYIPGPLLEVLIYMRMLKFLLPINTVLTYYQAKANMTLAGSHGILSKFTISSAVAQTAFNIALLSGIGLLAVAGAAFLKMGGAMKWLTPITWALAGALMVLALSKTAAFNPASWFTGGLPVALLAGALVAGSVGVLAISASNAFDAGNTLPSPTGMSDALGGGVGPPSPIIQPFEGASFVTFEDAANMSFVREREGT